MRRVEVADMWFVASARRIRRAGIGSSIGTVRGESPRTNREQWGGKDNLTIRQSGA